MQSNLLRETIQCLSENGKSPSDVLWVGRSQYSCCGHDAVGRPIHKLQSYKSTWQDFCSKADFIYNAGYGLPEIPTDLIVVGEDFWLERADYDGSEWWVFKTMPTEPEETRELDLRGD